MSRGDLDYPNHMCQSLFENSESFKSEIEGGK